MAIWSTWRESRHPETAAGWDKAQGVGRVRVLRAPLPAVHSLSQVTLARRRPRAEAPAGAGIGKVVGELRAR